MPRLPQPEDFGKDIVLGIVAPPESQAPNNALVLLHGIGDTNAPFIGLGRQLSLPYTVCLSIQGPTPLPFDLGGFHWGDDIIFDQASGRMDFDTGFDKATKLLAQDVIKAGLMDKCGFAPREVLIYGLGQGAMAGLAAARSLGEVELGGIVSIGGPLPASARLNSRQSKAKTPVAVAGGSSQSLVTVSAVNNLKETFASVQTIQWKRPGDAMPGNRDEMYPIMQFLARRLRSRAGVPPDAVELG